METANTYAASTYSKFPSAANLEQYFIDQAIKRYGTLFGQPSYPVYWAYDAVGGGPVPIATTAAVTPNTDTTNTQVKGVDEADLIETDGKYLYQVNGQTLTIVDVQDRSALRITSQFSIPSPWGFAAGDQPTTNPTPLPTFTIGGPSGGWNNIDGMYLQGDRLTVISTGWTPSPATLASSSIRYPGWQTPNQSQVQVTVLDVADPNHVSILEVSVMEGNLITSRAIGDEVFVVTSNAWGLPTPLVVPNKVDNFAVTEPIGSPANIIAPPYYPYPTGTYETKEAYLARIKDQVLDLGLPNVVTRNAYGETVESGLLSPATSIYQPLGDTLYPQLFNLSTFNVRDTHLGVDQVSGIPKEWGNNVFVSAEHLYLLQPNYNPNGSTKILEFDLDTSALIATGEVPGSIDDRFSVDEHERFLRISTTTNFGTAARNNVYILDQVGARLDVVGKLEGLAPGERIFSTRFQGDYGFVVTFRQVDPLFTIDLSDPKNPKVAGELKIPGFSEYLQVIEQDGKSLLLGVGRTADPVTGRAGALKVSLFDVSNPNAAREIESYVFADQYSTSDALWDPKAITYVPDQKLLAIPNRRYFNYPSEARLTVFSVDAQQGLDRIGEVSHDNDWINRSVSIRNDLYAVSGNQISSYDMPGLAALGDIKWNAEKMPIDYIQFSVPEISANLLGDIATPQAVNADSDIVDQFEPELNQFGQSNGLTFGDSNTRQGDGFASIQVGDRQLARVNWVDAIGLNQANNFMTV